MALPQELLDCLHIKRIEMATKLNVLENGVIAFVHIIPVKEVKAQKYYNNLAPTVAYEIRLLKHKDVYTNEEWGWDWDYVLDDSATRIKRLFVNRSDDNHELEAVLTSLEIDIDGFNCTGCFDSPLLDGVIEICFEYPDETPHLWGEF